MQNINPFHTIDYKEVISENIELLESLETQAFTAIVNTAMNGVYRELHLLMEEGDTYDFELPMFEDTDDINLDILVRLVKCIKTTKEKLIQLNQKSK